MRVTCNEFNPLVFTTTLPFDNGDEIKVNIEYEKLANYCRHCFRMFHLAVACPELCGQVEQGGEKKGESYQSRDDASGQKAEGGWEVVRKRPVKRALHMTDFATKDSDFSQKDNGRNGRQIFQGYEKSGNSQCEGRNFMKERQRNDVWEGQSRDSKQVFQKQNDTIYRAKEGRPLSYGRGRPSGWPIPLHQAQKNDGESLMSKAGEKGISDKEFDKVERDIKGIGKEFSKMVVTGESGTNLEDQIGDEDDDLLVEEGELMIEEYLSEDQVGEETGIAGQQLVNKAKIPEGNIHNSFIYGR